MRKAEVSRNTLETQITVAINIDGTGLEKITTESNFNAFPMFSYDGKKIIFSSNRNNGGTRDTNLFIADWVD